MNGPLPEPARPYITAGPLKMIEDEELDRLGSIVADAITGVEFTAARLWDVPNPRAVEVLLNSRRENKVRQLVLTTTPDRRIYIRKMEDGNEASYVSRCPAPLSYLNLLMKL
ncbi:MAG: hypothetical protein JRM78_03535 [Nitrososphaerota archaeon]|jgi:hypothetical protein|nr:hypothetical protein [Nitrososphaerota archaeon]MDG7042382.1 hypothetical protein [Nitrososphaerota archaeon]